MRTTIDKWSHIALSVALTMGTTASRGEDCGTVVTAAQTQRELQIRAAGEIAEAAALADPWYFPIKFHIVRRSDGTGGLTEAELATSLEQLNAHYVQVGFIFIQHGGVHYIDSDGFYDLNGEVEGDALRLQSPTSNVINVYFVRSYVVPDGSLCGQSSFTSSGFQGIIMDQDCADGTTLPHEVGHYFDLYHTHETAFGFECPNGSNCGDAGDLLCDTPADPKLSDLVTAAPACSYIGPSSSICGTYHPQTNNLMSYAPKACRDLFTGSQRSKMPSVVLLFRTNLFSRTTYVKSTAGAAGIGWPTSPFRLLSQGVAATGAGEYLFVHSGNYPTPITISTPAVLNKWDSGGTIVIGQ